MRDPIEPAGDPSGLPNRDVYEAQGADGILGATVSPADHQFVPGTAPVARGLQFMVNGPVMPPGGSP